MFISIKNNFIFCQIKIKVITLHLFQLGDLTIKKTEEFITFTYGTNLQNVSFAI